MRVLLALALTTAVTSTPDVRKLVLKPAQFDSGYVVLMRKDGNGVEGTVTLDLCGRKGYRSEARRVARLQVDYRKPKSTIGLSNEVVRYRPGGAAQAMREVISHALTCPSTPIDTGQAGLPPLRFTITRLKETKLLEGYLAVRVRVRGTINGKKVDQTSYAAYQRYGDVLSGVYSFGANSKEQQSLFVRAAQESAKNLRRGSAPPDPPTA